MKFGSTLKSLPDWSAQVAKVIAVVFLTGITTASQAASPVVRNVSLEVGDGGKLNIGYDVADEEGDELAISVRISIDGGASFLKPAQALTAGATAGYPNVTFGAGETSLEGREIVWDATADLGEDFVGDLQVRVIATDGTEPAAAPDGFSLIPAGEFQMGQADGKVNEVPVHGVFVSAFYMEQLEVSKSLWDSVYTWALDNGYDFENAGSGSADDHPVQMVDWYDSTKWCNARSEMEGLTPSYYVDNTRGPNTVYRTGKLDLLASQVDWDANGYRLPTEAQWEKAARGGLEAKLFPWGDEGTGADLNFNGSGDPFEAGAPPTTPVGYYNGSQVPAGVDRANAFGLYDMTGNVWEWCWDWYTDFYYADPSATYPDTAGPDRSSMSLTDRPLRGGAWTFAANDARCAVRFCPRPDNQHPSYGIRCARGAPLGNYANSSPLSIGLASPFLITRITRSAEGPSIELEWTSTEGATYNIEFSGTLQSDNWLPVNDAPIAGAAGTTSFTDMLASRVGSLNGYYRVVKLP
jgi:sulfatase modifying factor 1